MLGAAGSFLAGVWKFLTGDSGQRNTDFMKRLTSLTERTRKAASEDEIEALEGEIEEAFSSYLEAQAKGQIELEQIPALNLIFGHLESAIERRRRSLKERASAPARA